MTTKRKHLVGTGWTIELRNDGEEAAYRDVWVENVYQLGHDQLTGAVVIDVGSNIGLFTAFALARGAVGVVAVDPVVEHLARAGALLAGEPVTWIYAAAGDGHDQHLDPATSGVDQRTYPTGDIPGITLDRLYAEAREIGDRVICKVDAEGAEYALIRAASSETMLGIERFVMEWHWRLGERIGPLVELLLRTHSVTVYGQPSIGGMLYAYRY